MKIKGMKKLNSAQPLLGIKLEEIIAVKFLNPTQESLQVVNQIF